jgi:hypothetical protein
MRGRIRTFKPELFKDEELWDLGVETGLPVFQAFTGLWPYCDREGRFEWRPRALKTDVLPYWNGDFEAVLNALASRAFIVRYTVDGREYGHVRTLKRHQRFDHREVPSEIPAPPATPPGTDAQHPPGTPGQTETVPANDVAPSPGHARVEGKGMEGKGIGMEGKGSGDDTERPAADAAPPKPPKRSKSKSRTALPEALAPSAGDESLATELRVDLAVEFPKFLDHHLAHGSLMADWPAALRKWIRNAHEWGRSGSVPRSPDDRVRRQADRIAMLRRQEANETRHNPGPEAAPQ